MCGLSGVMSSSLAWNEEGMFRDLLSVSSLRGIEGSGVIISQPTPMKKTPTIRTLKSPNISGWLANSGELAELLKPRVNIAVGHARWPTKGGVDIEAVHPHRAGHIIGVHNGTMHRVGGELVKDQSDSAMLFKSFAEKGVEETIKESDGAYSLIWIDEREQTLNFLRNAQRTLYFTNVGWNKNINTLYWASERQMLDFVFARSYKGDNAWDTYLPVDTWFKYPLDVKHMIQPQEVVSNVRPTPRPVAPVSHYRGPVGGYGRFDRDHDDYDIGNNIPWVRQQARERLALPNFSASNVTPMSKSAAKKALKERKQEAAARHRTAGTFHNVMWDDEVQDYIPRKSKPVNIKAALNDLLPDHMRAAHDAQSTDDRHVPTYMQLEGRPCCWCGCPAEVGQQVYYASVSDTGAKQFVCMDCSTTPGCVEFIDNEFTVVTVSP